MARVGDETNYFEDRGEISDGYHTFNELYRYRMLYNAIAFNELCDRGFKVQKSIRHSDGELCFGGSHFIVIAELPSGQVSNHYKLKYWDLFHVREVDIPTIMYDGHTPNEAADRLESFILGYSIYKEFKQ